MNAPVAKVNLKQLQTHCSTCSLRELCLPMGLSEEEVEHLDRLVSNRRQLKRGDCLYRNGDAFASIYAVRSGFFKSRVTSDDGRDQVTGFHMPGEIIGMDGIGTERHTLDTVALEDSEAFLINLSQRFLARGWSPSDFHLRMTREEIGSYLGLKLETVSRLFSRFQEEGLVSVQQKHIRILDVPGLKKIVGQEPC